MRTARNLKSCKYCSIIHSQDVAVSWNVWAQWRIAGAAVCPDVVWGGLTCGCREGTNSLDGVYIDSTKIIDH